ncbi:hypothetical protein [Streptomyces malaysiensis]|uniref:hypothetical protein n=1 Tax=Streptomyces malaysiensis TaxID=92644 RepID=UPI0037171421
MTPTAAADVVLLRLAAWIEAGGVCRRSAAKLMSMRCCTGLAGWSGPLNGASVACSARWISFGGPAEEVIRTGSSGR